VTGAIKGVATKTRGVSNYLLVQNSRLNADGVYGAVLLLTAIRSRGLLVVLPSARRRREDATTARRWRRGRSAGSSVSSGAPVQEDGSAQTEGGRP
jgi:hypothetical protein